MVSNFRNTNNLNTQLMGLSTDTKPTVGVEPNALFWELDTNGMYFFDGTAWQSIGGSGGGGSSDFSTAEVTFAGTGTERFYCPVIINGHLYNGVLYGSQFAEDRTYTIVYSSESSIQMVLVNTTPTDVTGDAYYDDEGGYVDIEGDCTITIS